MGDYGSAAEFYDLLYAGVKDYQAEAELLASVIRDAAPDARRLLDVGCGTGSMLAASRRRASMWLAWTSSRRSSRSRAAATRADASAWRT